MLDIKTKSYLPFSLLFASFAFFFLDEIQQVEVSFRTDYLNWVENVLNLKFKINKEFYIPNHMFAESLHYRIHLPSKQNTVEIFDKYSMGEHNASDIILLNEWYNISVGYLKDVFVNEGSCPVDQKHFYMSEQPPSNLEWIYGKDDATIKNTYEYAIAVGHIGMGCYGHFFLDALGPLATFPEDILKKSIILNMFALRKEEDAILLQVVGFEKDRIRYFNDTCFVHHLYILYNPLPHLKHLSYSIQQLTLKLRRHFNLSSLPPNRYVLSNRNGQRRFGNQDEVFNAIKNSYKDINWEVISDKMSVHEQAKTFNEVKFWYTITGSNLIRMYYMQPNTMVISCQVEHNDIAMQSIAYSNRISMICYRNDPNTRHFGWDPFQGAVDKAIKYVGYGLERLSNKTR